jgi:hypothetical protein
MEDVNISKFRAQVVRAGSTPASPGFAVSEGQNPVDPSGSGQTHLPVTIATAATGLSITESQILGGAGTVAQYIRGDGSLADFPESSGGGSSVSYYLNGSVSQGTIGGVAYLEMNKVPILGAGTDFTRNSNGYIASFITDAGDPNLLEIPGGNWNFESYFSASSGGGSPTFYVELYKVNSGGTATLIASNSANPELISFGTTIAPYFSSLAVPTTVLALTDRLAVRYYVTPSGRTLTLHTEGPHLCQIITTFTTGLTALNGLTAQVQFFAVGTSGTDFNIASATATHTFNLPTASGTNRGALSSADWTTFNNKENAITAGTTAQYYRGDKTFQTLNTAVVPELTNLYYTEARVSANTDVAANTAARHNAVTLGTANGLSLSTQQLSLQLASGSQNGALSSTDWTTFNSKENAISAGTTAQYFRGDKTFQTLNTAAVPELTNLYYTEARVNANANVAANTAARHNAVTLGTANGLSLSTQQLSLGLASAGITGALSGTDWSTFNSKQQALNGTGFVKISGTTISYDNSTYYLASNPSAFIALTALSGTAPIQYNNTTGAISITQASGSTNGFLSSTDWNTFNNKTSNVGTVTSVAALTLGTSGTDLSSTVANSTTTPVITLNVPTASASNRGALSAADWTTFNGKQDNIVAGTTAQYYRGDKTFQTLNTAAVPELTNLYYTEARVSANTDVAANTAARHAAVTLGTTNGLSLSTQQLSLGLASSSANGALSSTDWTTFNNKQNALTNPVTGTGTTNYLPKFTGTSTIGDSVIQESGSNIGIGVTPISKFDINVGASGARRFLVNYDDSLITIKGSNASGNGETLRIIADNIRFNTGSSGSGTERMRLDLSGNLGLGVTPSAWFSTVKAIDISTATALWAGGNGQPALGYNVFVNTSGNLIYKTSEFASRYEQISGQHQWFNAPSGTAGNAISFTQAMTLGSNSGLSIGTPSAAPSQGLLVQGNVGIGGSIFGKLSVEATGNHITLRAPGATAGKYWALDVTTANQLYVINNAGTQYFTMTDAGNFGIGTASPSGKLHLSSTGDTYLVMTGGATPRTYSWLVDATNLRLFSGVGDTTLLTIASTGAATFTTTSGNGITIVTNDVTTLKMNSTSGYSKSWGFATTNLATSDFGIYQSTSNGGDAISAGTPRLYFSGGGNVGIGTTSPSQRLEVAGIMRGEAVNVYGSTDPASTSPYLFSPSLGALGFGGNGSEKMRIFSDGNVGINTGATNAGFKLDVNGTGRFSGVLRVMTHYAEYSDAEFMGALGFNRNPATGAIFNNARAAFQLQNNLGTFQFKAFSSAGADLGTPLSISSTGAATFSSSVTANARSFIQGAAGYLFDVQTTDANQPRFQVYVDDTNGVDLISGYNSTAKSLRFVTGNTTRMTITSGGNVLIGSAGDNGGKLRVKNTTNAYVIAFEKWNSTLTLGGFFQNSGSSGEMILVDTNGSQNVLISSSGNSYWNAPSARFSIGTTVNTTDLFRVNGTTFSNDIMTWNPQNDNRSGIAWRFGEASIASITPNRRLRVNVGGIEYYIGAIEV